MQFHKWALCDFSARKLENDLATLPLIRYNSFLGGGRTCELDIHRWAAVSACLGPSGSTAGPWGTACCWPLWSNNSPLLHKTAIAAQGHVWNRTKEGGIIGCSNATLHIQRIMHMYAAHLSARTATRMHRSGSRSVLAPAASNISAHVVSPLEIAK